MVKWLIRGIAVLVILLGVALAGLMVLPADRIARIAVDQMRALTGRDVTITGDVAVTFWPVLGASVDGIEVGSTDWARQGPLLTASKAAIGVDALALLRGEVRITNIAAQSPTIRLESRADGRTSWAFTDASGAARIETEINPDRAPKAVSIQRLDVTDATLIYDAEGADLVRYEGVDLTLDWPDRDGPAQIDAVLHPTETPVTVKALIEGFAGFLAGERSALNAQITAGPGRASLSGTAMIKGNLSAPDLRLTTTDTAAFLRALGVPAGEIPPGLGRSADITAALAIDDAQTLTLSQFRADLGEGNVVRGAMRVGLTGVPQIQGRVELGAFDLKPALAGRTGDAGTGGQGAAQGWPTSPIAPDWLAAFNGGVSLAADAVDFGTIRLGAMQGSLANDQSRMVVTLRQAQAYSGTLTGEFVVNNRSGLSVGGNLAGQGVALEGLLSDLMGITRITGAAKADLQFLGVGGSVDAIMNSLSGSGSLRVDQGAIRGIDLNDIIASGIAGGGTTRFDSLGATFTIENGQLRNSDLLMALADYEARGAGRIGLGPRDLDYTFTPKALRANDGRGLAIPVRILGPWANPRIQPDLDAAINLNAKEEVREIRKKVEEDVKRERDKLEDKLEQELGKRLKKLFD